MNFWLIGRLSGRLVSQSVDGFQAARLIRID